MLAVVVPILTFPLFHTTKLVPVELPMANAGAVPFVLVGFTESCAHGEDEPTPTNPAAVMVVVAVPPKYARVAESCVDEALPLKSINDVVADCPAAGCVQASYDARPLPVIVIGEAPKATKPVQEAVPAQVTVVVAAPAPPAI